MKFWKRFGWQILIALVAISGMTWIHASRVITETEAFNQIAAARVNFAAPDFALDTLDGKRITLSDLRGKVVIVNFWATWCPPCRAEMNDLQSAYQAHQNDFVLLAINNSEEDADVQKFVAEFHLTFPILLDRDGQVAKQYNVLALPTSFIIDRKGIVRAVNVGGMNRVYIEAQLLSQGVTRR